MCECPPGYSGDICQNSVCQDKECANGGSCLIGKGPSKSDNRYQCTMVDTWFMVRIFVLTLWNFCQIWILILGREKKEGYFAPCLQYRKYSLGILSGKSQ